MSDGTVVPSAVPSPRSLIGEADAALALQPCLCTNDFRCSRCKGRDSLAALNRHFLEGLDDTTAKEEQAWKAGYGRGFTEGVKSVL